VQVSAEMESCPPQCPASGAAGLLIPCHHVLLPAQPVPPTWGGHTALGYRERSWGGLGFSGALGSTVLGCGDHYGKEKVMLDSLW